MEEPDEVDEVLAELREVKELFKERMEAWTCFVSGNGERSVHCPVSAISHIIREVGTEATHGLGMDGRHLVWVSAQGWNTCIGDYGTEGEAEEAIAEFLGTRGLGQ